MTKLRQLLGDEDQSRHGLRSSSGHGYGRTIAPRLETFRTANEEMIMRNNPSLEYRSCPFIQSLGKRLGNEFDAEKTRAVLEPALSVFKEVFREDETHILEAKLQLACTSQRFNQQVDVLDVRLAMGCLLEFYMSGAIRN